jgi:hemoglobin/transferrin/lactoferrin receptor protein
MKSISVQCCLVLICTLLYGQEKDSTFINPKKFLLDEMVISANRWEQNIREVPNRISKVSSSLIQFQNPQTAADLLGASNQVFIQKSQLGGGSPMIRGFSTSRVLLVVDGVRMNNAIFRSGNVQNVISLDPNVIEESEVIFGPGSVIYGSDAIGGVMDFHSMTPTFAIDKKVNLKINGMTRYASSNQESTNHIDFNIGFKKLAFVTSATYFDFDDLRMGSHGPDEYLRPDYQKRINGVDTVLVNSDPELQVPTGYTQKNFTQKIAYQAGDHFLLTYGFHYSQTSDVPRYDRLILKSNPPFNSSEWYYGPQKWIMHTLQTSLDNPTILWDHARFTLAYQDYEESRHNRNFGAANRTNRFENIKAYSANIDLDKKINDRAELFYGAEYIGNTVGSTAYRNNINNGTLSPTTTRYPDGSTWQSVAAYGSVKYKISDQFLLNASVRATNVQTEATYDTALFDFPFTQASLNNTAVNGSLGMVYNPTQQWKFYTNLATGFRAPNVDDIGKVFDSQPGDVVIPNPDLKPEFAYNAEIGYVGRMGDFTFDGAGYYSVIDNAIARASTTFNGEDSIDYDGTLSRVLSQQNISSVKVGGIQVGFNWQVSQNWLITSNLNFQKGKETYSDSTETYSPTHVAPLFGSTHIQFTLETIKIDLYSNYNGTIQYYNLALSERADQHLYAKDENGYPYAPSWWTLNLKTSFTAAKYLTIDAGVENILDKRYRPYSSGITAPGRNVIIALRVKI